MNTATQTEVEPIERHVGAFIIYFKDKVTIPRDDHGFDIEDGVAYISHGKFERFRERYQFTVNGVESVMDVDEVRKIDVLN